MNEDTKQTLIVSFAVVLIAVAASLLGLRGCEQQHAQDMERIKQGQVYVRQGWITPAKAENASKAEAPRN